MGATLTLSCMLSPHLIHSTDYYLIGPRSSHLLFQGPGLKVLPRRLHSIPKKSILTYPEPHLSLH